MKAGGISTGQGSPVLRYGGLEARDARGESLDARLAVLSRGIQIRFEAAGTAYPITVSVATSVAAGGPLGAGEGSFYLVRGVNCGGVGSYDSGDPGQAGSRDAEIGASVLACP